MRFFSVALLTAAVSALSVSATQCSSSQFLWNKNKEACLPFGKPSSTPAPPSGKSCPPNEWYWHWQSSCCVPTKPNPPPPSCSEGSWDDSTQCCHHGTSTSSSGPVPTHGWGGGDNGNNGNDGNGGKGGNNWTQGGNNNGHGKGGKGDRRRAARTNRLARNSA